MNQNPEDRFVIPCTIFGILSGILFWKWGKGIHLAPAIIPWLYLLFKCYKFEGNENLISQAIREGNLTKLGLTLGLPVTTPIILGLLTN